jgi:hypothetical protein
MSNDVSIFNNQSAQLSNKPRMTALGQSVASSSTLTNRRIQTNTNGTFKKLVNGEQVGEAIRGEFQCIIVGMLPAVSRIYYKEKYDPKKEATLPNCWSNLGDKPEAAATDIQHTNCKECSMNIAGSGETGGRACRFQRRISLVLANDPQAQVYQFNIPAKSLFGKGVGNVHPYESYVRFLLSNGQSPDTVVTTIKYDDNADAMEMLFSPLREISDEEEVLVLEAQSKQETKMYTRLTVGQTDGVVKLAPTDKEPTATLPAPVVKDEEVTPTKVEATSSELVEDAIEEPVARTKKKEVPIAQDEDDLFAAVSAWAEDD